MAEAEQSDQSLDYRRRETGSRDQQTEDRLETGSRDQQTEDRLGTESHDQQTEDRLGTESRDQQTADRFEVASRDQETELAAYDLNDRCPIERLPNELLTQILSELDQTSLSRCAQLSRRWQRLATQPRLWQNIGNVLWFWNRQRSLPPVWLTEGLLELRAFGSTISDLAQLLGNSPNLRSLTLNLHGGYDRKDFDHCTLEENPLEVLGLCCPNLQKLDLGLPRELNTSSTLEYLPDFLPCLTQLKIRNKLRGYTDLMLTDGFAVLAARLTSLSLTIKGHLHGRNFPAMPECTKLTIKSKKPMPALADLQFVLSQLPRLSKLTLQQGDVTDSLAAELAAAGSGLRSLKLYRCFSLTDQGLKALLDRCPNLWRLHLFDCYFLTGGSYDLVSGHLKPGLKDLRLYNPEYFGLIAPDLTRPLPQSLRRLELTGLYTCSYIMRLLIGLTNCTELADLTLDVCSDDLLPALLTQLPRLRCLQLTDCSRLTRQAWANLRDLQSVTVSLPDLHEFRAEICSESSLTDEAVADLCSSPVARGLRRLRLSKCSQLTAAARASIASGCPLLTQLLLLNCSQSNSMGLAAEFNDFQSTWEHSVLFSAYDVPFY